MAPDHQPASSLIIDTSVLSLLVVYHRCIERRIRPPERKTVLFDIWGQNNDLPQDQFDVLWRVFENAARRTVTQHVIVETLNCRSGWFERHTGEARTYAISLMDKYAVDEQSCRIRDLAADEICQKALIELGPADAGLLWVAKSIGATLLSEDERLREWARGCGLFAYPVGRIHLLA